MRIGVEVVGVFVVDVGSGDEGVGIIGLELLLKGGFFAKELGGDFLMVLLGVEENLFFFHFVFLLLFLLEGVEILPSLSDIFSQHSI